MPRPEIEKYVLDRHQERLVLLPLRRRDVGVHRLHQLLDVLLRRFLPVQRIQRRSPNHRNVISGKLVTRQQFPDFQLHQLQKLRVVYRIHLVQKHDNVGHPDLASQQDMLPGLRHRPVRGRHHQYRPVHLRRPGDHVLDVVGMSRTVHVRVVAVGRLILDVRHRDRDPPRLLLRRVVNRIKRSKRYARIVLLQDLCDRRRQRRLAVIDVPDRPHIHVRLRAIKFLLRHTLSSSLCLIQSPCRRMRSRGE